MNRENTFTRRIICTIIALLVMLSIFTIVTTDEVSAASKAPAKVKTVKVASYDYNALKITWSKASKAKKYQVYRATSKNGKYKLVKTTTTRSYVNKKLTTGKKYYYKVRAVSGSKKGAFSPKKYGTPTLKKVSGIKAAASGSSAVKVSWSKVTGASGYVLYRATSKTGTYAKAATTKSLSFTNTGFTTCKPYYYKVRAYRKVGSKTYYSPYSTIIKGSTGAHNHCVPVYTLNYDSACRWCNKQPHGDTMTDGDFLCGNWGSTQYATIAAYRCLNCTDMIDVKHYAHTCDWQPVYGIADMDRCIYCGDEGFTTFAENDTRLENATFNVTMRNIHKENGCYQKLLADHPELDKSKDYSKLMNILLSGDYRKEYISYWQCSKCSRIRNNDAPEVTLQVEGEMVQTHLIRGENEWDLTGTEWIFPTLENLDAKTDCLVAYEPIFSYYKYNTTPQSESTHTEVGNYTCKYCSKTIYMPDDPWALTWDWHICKN